MKAGTLTAVPDARCPGCEVDETPLPLETAVAFPDLQVDRLEGRDRRPARSCRCGRSS